MGARESSMASSLSALCFAFALASNSATDALRFRDGAGVGRVVVGGAGGELGGVSRAMSEGAGDGSRDETSIGDAGVDAGVCAGTSVVGWGEGEVVFPNEAVLLGGGVGSSCGGVRGREGTQEVGMGESVG